MKPDNEEVVRTAEQLGKILYESEEDNTHHFTFVYADRFWDCYPFSPVPRAVKAWIVRSRRLHPEEWRRSVAVVLSYRGKKTIRLNVVVQGDDQAYLLEVSLKTGDMRWKALDTKAATELKEALKKVAQR